MQKLAKVISKFDQQTNGDIRHSTSHVVFYKLYQNAFIWNNCKIQHNYSSSTHFSTNFIKSQNK